MANEWTALNSFWNSFDMPAYDENTVPDDASTPYITYEASTGGMGDVLSLTGNLWYPNTTSWAGISNKATEIGRMIGGGSSVLFDNGRLWVTKRMPFAIRMDEPNDPNMRRIVLQINAEFQMGE